jgi:ABC-type multidrug transport system fused ATPase/permease subunit
MAVVLAMSAVIGCGGWSVVAGSLSIGSLVAFYSFVTQLFDPLSGAAELYARAQRMFASIRQLQAVFELRPTITNPPVCAPFPRNDWGLEFRAVEFGYEPSTRTLLIPSLRIAAGEKIAIAGENGAGKSTLARLVTRLYDIRSGSIRIGGIDIRDIGLKELRRQVCYLPRDPILFEGSLASNLRFVRPGASDGELLEAIELTDLASAITALPAGLHQRLGPDACQLSGGQRQRLAIARALLKRPRILILDEATSCLDPAAEALILHNVVRYLPTSTLIVVSHRSSTLSDFTRVLVLSSGRIAADLGVDAISTCEMLASKRLSFVPAAPKPD